MKLKVASTLLLLAGSAHAQLISSTNESGLPSVYRHRPLFGVTGKGASAAFDTTSTLRFAISFRDDISAMPIFAGDSRFQSGAQVLSLPRFTDDSTTEADTLVSSEQANPVTISETGTRGQTDEIRGAHDQDVFALLAPATLP